MATEAPVNGNYSSHQGYASLEQNHAAYSSQSQPSFSSATPSSTAATSANNSASEIPKDEVGWYFVEQYYTTLSRSPEKLYLFYAKRSQFVSGNETEKIAVCVGQRAINERIKELDFQDCKVRVTNVDSQASDENIVIQVIGEISNKSAPHKKFTQTFVLAGQTNGYFVLNDIFRYIVEEEDEIEAENNEVPEDPASVLSSSGFQEPAPTAAEEQEPKTLTSSEDPVAVEHDAVTLDKELEEKVLNAPQPEEEEAATPPAAVNGDKDAEAEVVHAEEAPAAAVSASEEASVPAVEEPAPVEPALQVEAPKDPEPSPAMSPAKQAPAKPATPVAAPKSSAPKSWASLAAAAHRVATPAVAVPQTSTPAATAQPKTASAPAPTSAATPASTTQAASSTAAPAAREPSPAASQQDEWTSVGGDSKRKESKTQAAAGAQEGTQNRAYIKNVHENMDQNQLRALLEKFGEIVYFDVAKAKNCAFVDFKTPEGYKAAIEANPHTIGNDRVTVEERRTKPGSYPYVQRGGMRGGRGGANQGPNRGSFQGQGRGGFPQRGRGGAPRGRGGAPAA